MDNTPIFRQPDLHLIVFENGSIRGDDVLQRKVEIRSLSSRDVWADHSALAEKPMAANT